MKTIFTLLFLPIALFSQRLQVENPLRFLALGDSYTIGESVGANERWPVQLSDSLLQRGIITDTLTIIATTGWRTDDLLNAISGQNLKNKNYNLVSVLIGVNNQYQNKPFSQYQTEFPQLLDSALIYAGGDTGRVFVVSIPDYAYTPFGQQSSNPSQISNALDQYNLYNKHVADSFKIRYFDITPISRQGLTNPNYVAGDGLHPSGVQYAQWVKLMLSEIDVLITDIPSNKKNNEIGINIFPNPASDLITIHSNEATFGKMAISIYDFTGREIIKEQTNSIQMVIPTTHLADGVYTVKINSATGQGVKRLMITH